MTVKNTFKSYACANNVFGRALAATSFQVRIQQRMPDPDQATAIVRRSEPD